jgi:Ca2+-transporting ATPase
VLAPVLPRFRSGDWVLRTAVAASAAWAVGLTPAAPGGAVTDWPVAVQVAGGLAGGAVLLCSLGVAQASVLRGCVPRSGRWVGWTAAGRLAGLAVFTALTTPLWQPGQGPLAVALIGIAGGAAMAVTVALVTGWGMVRMLLGPVVGLALPLLPAQVLWVNLLTHGPVGVAMGTEPAAPDVLGRAPRSPAAGVFDREPVAQVGALAAAVVAVCPGAAVVSRAEEGPGQTQLFVTLAVGADVLLLAAAVYLPALAAVLGTEPLTVAELAASVAAALVPAALLLVLRGSRRRPAGGPAGTGTAASGAGRPAALVRQGAAEGTSPWT